MEVVVGIAVLALFCHLTAAFLGSLARRGGRLRRGRVRWCQE